MAMDLNDSVRALVKEELRAIDARMRSVVEDAVRATLRKMLGGADATPAASPAASPAAAGRPFRRNAATTARKEMFYNYVLRNPGCTKEEAAEHFAHDPLWRGLSSIVGCLRNYIDRDHDSDEHVKVMAGGKLYPTEWLAKNGSVRVRLSRTKSRRHVTKPKVERELHLIRLLGETPRACVEDLAEFCKGQDPWRDINDIPRTIRSYMKDLEEQGIARISPTGECYLIDPAA
jgi:hypothetical protein